MKVNRGLEHQALQLGKDGGRISEDKFIVDVGTATAKAPLQPTQKKKITVKQVLNMMG